MCSQIPNPPSAPRGTSYFAAGRTPGAIAHRLCPGPVPAPQRPTPLPISHPGAAGPRGSCVPGGPELQEPEAPTVTRTTGCCLRSCFLLLQPCKPPPAAARALPMAVPAESGEPGPPPRAREHPTVRGASPRLATEPPTSSAPRRGWRSAARRAGLVQLQHVQRLLQQGFACQRGIKPVR